VTAAGDAPQRPDKQLLELLAQVVRDARLLDLIQKLV
jgi:hypothetical protein